MTASIPVVPGWVPPRVRPDRNSINRNASSASERRATVAAEGEVVPVVYGRDQVGAKIGAVTQSGNNWVVQCIWCHGGRTGVDAIESVTAGGQAATQVAWTHYLGTSTQGIDPTLAALIADYTDTLTFSDGGVDSAFAYSVAVYPQSLGWLQFEATIRGLKLYDPRDGGQAVADPSTWTYSDNAGLVLADFEASSLYGRARNVDWTSVATLADACDDPLADSSPRRRVGITLLNKSPVDQWLETLRAYAGAIVVQDGGSTSLVPDRPASTSRALTITDVAEGSLRINSRGLGNAPTVVTVWYTDTSGAEWRDRPARAYATGVQAGAVPWRESVIRMPGITTYAQAYREAVERLNYGALVDLDVSWETFDEGLQDQAGDVVELTHPYGLTAKPFRLLSVQTQSPGRWSVRAEEYQPGVYSDSIESEPTYSDTSLPDPNNPPQLTGLGVVEEVFQLQNGNWASRLRVSWDAPDYPYAKSYAVAVYASTDLIWSGTTTALQIPTPAVQEGIYYSVEATVVTSTGGESNPAVDYITAQGKYLIPGDVPSVTGFEVGGEVRLSWTPAVDIDIWRYEVRYGAEGVTWENAALLDRVDALRLVTKEVPAGTWDFIVRALDSVGQYSANDARKKITVTTDAEAFLVGTNDFDTPTLTDVIAFALGRTDNSIRYVTADESETVNSMFSDPLDNYTNPLDTYHASVSGEWLSETWDLGLVISGNWLCDISNLSALSGTYTAQLELSTDAVSWDVYTSLSAKTGARYARVRITSATTSTLLLEMGSVTLRLDAVAREETGVITTLASGAKTVSVGAFSAVKEIILTPETSAPKNAVYDNIVLGDPATTFDIYLFNSVTGGQEAGTVRYKFRGV